MSFPDMPDLIVPPTHLRCMAMTKPESTSQKWRRNPHRCVRNWKWVREGRRVCSIHQRVPKVQFWDGVTPDDFVHKRFWKWPRSLQRQLGLIQ